EQHDDDDDDDAIFRTTQQSVDPRQLRCSASQRVTVSENLITRSTIHSYGRMALWHLLVWSVKRGIYDQICDAATICQSLLFVRAEGLFRTAAVAPLAFNSQPPSASRSVTTTPYEAPYAQLPWDDVAFAVVSPSAQRSPKNQTDRMVRGGRGVANGKTQTAAFLASSAEKTDCTVRSVFTDTWFLFSEWEIAHLKTGFPYLVRNRLRTIVDDFCPLPDF
ncbi:unnamed protein product, partial [Ectocarpus sp. 12 AP-2014]